MKRKRILFLRGHSGMPCVQAKLPFHFTYHLLVPEAEAQGLFHEVRMLNPDLLVIMDNMIGEKALSCLIRKVRQELGIQVICLNSCDAGTEHLLLEEQGAVYKLRTEFRERPDMERDPPVLNMYPAASVPFSSTVCKDNLFIRQEHQISRISLQEIIFVEAMKDYVLIQTQRQHYKAHISMKDLMDVLPGDEFARIHRSFIVRIDKITRMRHPILVVEGQNRTLPIGNYFRKDLYGRMIII